MHMHAALRGTTSRAELLPGWRIEASIRQHDSNFPSLHVGKRDQLRREFTAVRSAGGSSPVQVWARFRIQARYPAAAYITPVDTASKKIPVCRHEGQSALFRSGS